MLPPPGLVSLSMTATPVGLSAANVEPTGAIKTPAADHRL
jgi:hypothetical protein